MKAVVIRHAEVDFCWSRRSTSEGFDADCSGYDSAPVKEIEYEIPQFGYQKIYISELSRSRRTAEMLFPEGEYVESGLINEVPLRSGFDTKKKMLLWFWNILGRLQWFTNNKRQAESRDQTRERARRFVAMITSGNMDCAVVTHGFFMHTLISQMKQVGYKPSKNRILFRNGEVIVMENRKM